MDTDALSNTAYDIIVQAAQVSDTLKAQLGGLSQNYNNEDDWLRGVQSHLRKIGEEPDNYVEFWSLKEFEDVTADTMMELAAKLCDQVACLIRSRKGCQSNYKSMTDFYQNNSQSYFDSTAHLDSTSILVPIARDLSPGASILDVGCGSGRDLKWLANQGFNPTGFEQSPSLVVMAREFSGCPVIEGDFFTFDFADLSFDALLLVGALVHVERHLLLEILQRISGALTADGLIYLTLKEGAGERVADDGRVFTLWSQEQLEAIFRNLQLKVKDFSRQVSKLRSSDVWLGYLLSFGESNDSR